MSLDAKIEKGFLVVRVPVNATPVPSSTGKSLIVATTGGNQPTAITVDGKTVKVGLTAFCKQ